VEEADVDDPAEPLELAVEVEEKLAAELSGTAPGAVDVEVGFGRLTGGRGPLSEAALSPASQNCCARLCPGGFGGSCVCCCCC